ncbi:hypothetical protein [uncultured Marinobacter sp.]|uniref:hypothetical protein n=1 Tax=uncultured Marinobacter sp. TaxID=187379 RepID=UPI0026000CF1|nr:hypothetical protein [uncultured Marinobacter sp.]
MCDLEFSDEAFHFYSELVGTKIRLNRSVEKFGGMCACGKTAQDAACRTVTDTPDIGKILFPAGMAEQAMVSLLIKFTHGCRVQDSSGFFEK